MEQAEGNTQLRVRPVERLDIYRYPPPSPGTPSFYRDPPGPYYRDPHLYLLQINYIRGKKTFWKGYTTKVPTVECGELASATLYLLYRLFLQSTSSPSTTTIVTALLVILYFKFKLFLGYYFRLFKTSCQRFCEK